MPIKEMTSIVIAYDGEPVRDGSMNVYQLGKALLAIGDLLNASNRVLNGDRTVIDVTVRAEFKKGSFGIDCDVLLRAAELGVAILPIMPPSDLRSAGEVIKFLFEKGKSLVELLR